MRESRLIISEYGDGWEIRITMEINGSKVADLVLDKVNSEEEAEQRAKEIQSSLAAIWYE